MKVGTDGVLLGAWAEGNGQKIRHILDIGTGTGLIALMLAQRFPAATIHAIEIDVDAAKQAQQNVSASPWAARINIFAEALQTYQKNARQYDLIVSNPPYFQDAVKAKGQQRTYARHNNALSFEELLKGIHRLLAPNGTICLILPLEEARVFQQKALSYRLFTEKMTLVHPKAGEIAKRILLSMQFRLPNHLKKNSLMIRKAINNTYTDNYKDLLKDFYLHF